jgi:ABC-2 type transport system ATP-binding protein
LLDEPLSGLDPRARIEMRNLLRKLGQMGKTIIVSSHILPELADICNKVGIIDRGVMSVNAEVAQVMKQVRQQIVLVIGVVGDLDAARGILEQQDAVESIEQRNLDMWVTLAPGIEDYSDLSTALVNAGHRIRLFREDEVNLESAFMALTKGLGEKI